MVYTNDEARLWNEFARTVIGRIRSIAPRPACAIAPKSSKEVHVAIAKAQIGLRNEIEEMVHSLKMGVPEDAKAQHDQCGQAVDQPQAPESPPSPDGPGEYRGNWG